MLDALLLIVALAGRICAGLIFATAAVQKMRHWRVLEGVVGNYRLLPHRLVKPAAVLLPPVELALGAALLADATAPAAPVAGAALLLLFAGAMAINIARGRGHIDCGCHQSFLRQALSPILVARNAVLALLLLPAMLVHGAPNAVSSATGIAGGLAFFLLYHVVNLIAALPKPAPMAT